MLKIFEISTDSGRYTLSALVTKKGYEMPYLCERNIDNYLYGGETITDKIEYMVDALYPKIKEAVLNKDSISFVNWFNASVDIESEYRTFTIEELTEILEMFEEAIKLGFFKNKL